MTAPEVLYPRKRILLFAVLCLGAYVVLLLHLADSLIARLLDGYAPPVDPLVTFVIFCAAATPFGLVMRRPTLRDSRSFILGAVSLFFPLVFVSVAINTDPLAPNALHSMLGKTYCPADTERLCGAAFAISVYIAAFRALPVVLTVPALYWFFVIRPSTRARPK